MIWTNLVLTLSLVVSIPTLVQFLWFQEVGREAFLKIPLYLVFISAAYHLSDTRFGQSGIWPFQQHAVGMLLIYQCTMGASITAFFLFFYKRMTSGMWFHIMLGIAAWQLANHAGSQGYLTCFVLFHSYWNVVVFDCLKWSVAFFV